jgi:hypothetical protein
MTPAADLTNGLANAYMRNMLHYTIASPTSLTSRTIESEVSQIHVSLSSSQIFSPTTGSFPTRSLHYRLSVWGLAHCRKSLDFFGVAGLIWVRKTPFCALASAVLLATVLSPSITRTAYPRPEPRAKGIRPPALSPSDSHPRSPAATARWGRTRRTRRCSGRGWGRRPARPAPRTPPKTAWSVPFLSRLIHHIQISDSSSTA